jgi:hypothetical protein
MISTFATFGPASEETAVFYLAAVVCFVLAAFAATLAKRFPGGPLGLVALGLALWLWPTMWTSMDVAF